MDKFEKKVFNNGLRVLLLPVKNTHSASVSLWVTAGSRNETEKDAGLTHFIEHMMFKGTKTRSSKQISEEMDMLGGGMNAYTTKELTRYYAQTLGENATEAMDILCDMLMNSVMDEKELELEKGVVLDEIAMYEDDGENVAHEGLSKNVWTTSTAGRPIIGTTETVSNFTQKSIFSYINTNYTPDRIVAVAVGSFDRDSILEKLQSTLGTLPKRTSIQTFDTPVFKPSLSLVRKKFEQTSLVVGMPGVPAGDDKRYAMMLLNFIIGGGSSSRLFQRLREELGLAYSVYSTNTSARNAGLFTVTASFSKDKQELVLKEIEKMLNDLKDGVTKEEFIRASAQVKATYIMGLETVAARATYAGRNEIYEGRQIESDEVLDIFDKITIDHVNDLAKEIVGSGKRAVSIAGDIKEESFYLDFLKDD